MASRGHTPPACRRDGGCARACACVCTHTHHMCFASLSPNDGGAGVMASRGHTTPACRRDGGDLSLCHCLHLLTMHHSSVQMWPCRPPHDASGVSCIQPPTGGIKKSVPPPPPHRALDGGQFRFWSNLKVPFYVFLWHRSVLLDISSHI